MPRIAILTATAAFLVAAAPFASARQAPQPIPPGTPIREATMRYDPLTGTLVRVPGVTGGARPVYDNTCDVTRFLPLLTQAQNGGSESRAVGDWGAIPGLGYPSDLACVTGCASTYDVSGFEIGYCTVASIPTRAVVRFWDIPQSSCTATTPIGGVTPPAVPTAFSATLNGLPRAAVPGLLACYQVTIEIAPPGFTLSGGDNITPGSSVGDRFAWSFQMPSGVGLDGPLLAGNPGLPQCGFCTGTIWEYGNESPDPGTGFGQDDHLFTDDYGGTIPPNTCLQFPGGHPWAGLYLELASETVCSVATASSSFCDVTDGSLAFCPCSNPGAGDTGCDNAQMTGGVGLTVLAQDTTVNRATLIGTGYPIGSQPAAVVIRAESLDPSAPIVFGDGLRCISTPLVRLSGVLASNGISVHPIGHGAMAGAGFFYYQIWYRNQPASFCLLPPPAGGIRAYNLSNGRRLYWTQ
jgi:hypothetical protein